MRILNITTLSALAVLLITAGCNDSSNNSSANEEPEVIVKKPIKKDIVLWDDYIARLQAVESVKLRARVGGGIWKRSTSRRAIL